MISTIKNKNSLYYFFGVAVLLLLIFTVRLLLYSEDYNPLRQYLTSAFSTEKNQPIQSAQSIQLNQNEAPISAAAFSQSLKDLKNDLVQSNQNLTKNIQDTSAILTKSISKTATNVQSDLVSDIGSKLDLNGGTIDGKLTIDKNLTVGGIAYFNDILPDGDGKYNFGSSTKSWENIYAGNFNGLGLSSSSDGFIITGGSTSRILTVTGADVTLQGNNTGDQIDIPGNAGTVTNGLYSSGSYYNPDWLASLNTSKLSGTIGIGQGGTGTATQFTQGSLAFAGASGVYTQDNANLFWDDTNKRLGIGTASPGARLTIKGGDAGTIFNLMNSIDSSLFSVAYGGVITITTAGSSAGGLILNANTGPAPSVPHAGAIHVIGPDNDMGALYIDSFSSSGLGRSIINLRAARGTGAIPSASLAGDEFGRLSGRGYGGANGFTGSLSAVSFNAAEDITPTNQGSYIAFRTTALGTVGGGSLTVPPEVARFQPSGGLSLGNTYFNNLDDYGMGTLTMMHHDNTTATSGSQIYGARLRGSSALMPSIVQDGDSLLSLIGAGVNGNISAPTYLPGGQISFVVDGSPSLTAMPGGITFSTTPSGSQTPIERMRLTSAGYFGIGTTSPSSFFSIGATSQFQINSSGAIAAATGITSSGTINLSGLNTSSLVFTDASKNLTSTGTVGVAQGGTGTATPFTQGSLTFAGASGVYTQDNSNLFWDGTNKRLGIGTASPSVPLDIISDPNNGGILITGDYYGLANGLTIQSLTGLSAMMVSSVDGRPATYRLGQDGVRRWGMRKTFTSESGSNSGSDFEIESFTDAGSHFQYPIRITRASGYVGIGLADGILASSLFSVGATSQFQVNSSGAIAAATGITSSGTINLSGLNTSSLVFTDASKNLTSTGTVGVAQGGTGTTTQFTQGSLAFAGASGIYSQDNDNLFWDDANKRLGIGTASPGAALDINSNPTTPPTPIGAMHMTGNNGLPNVITLDSFAGLNGITYRRANGANGNSTALAANDVVGRFAWRGYDGVSYSSNHAIIEGYAAEAWTTSAHGMYLSFKTTSIGSIVAATERMRIADNGYVGIGATAPAAMLQIGTSAAGGNVRIDNGWLCVDNDGTCSGGTTAGTVYAVNTFATGADYAEYFYTKDANLKSGEAVCVDTEHDNAVERCQNNGDNNIMGIVSSNPSIVGNNNHADDPNYKIIGMLGQVPANISTENGLVQIGDSLTSASIPGYLRKADAGESTVGVALQKFEGTKGSIQVLISRRNKSLTVEKVEEAVTQRIAEMNVEDQVDTMVNNATEQLTKDTDAQTQSIASLQNRLTTQEGLMEELQIQIDALKAQTQSIASLPASIAQTDLNTQDIAYLKLALGLNDENPNDINIAGILTVKEIKTENLETNTVTINNADKDARVVGSAVIAAGEKEIKVETNAVKNDSKILVSPMGDNPVVWIISEKKEDTSFTIKIAEPLENDIHFDWWIIAEK